MVGEVYLRQTDIARKLETLLISFPNLSIVDLTRDVIRQAARIRAGYRIRTPDALQAAAILVNGGEVFVTNASRLKYLQPVLRVILLDDYRDKV